MTVNELIKLLQDTVEQDSKYGEYTVLAEDYSSIISKLVNGVTMSDLFKVATLTVTYPL